MGAVSIEFLRTVSARRREPVGIPNGGLEVVRSTIVRGMTLYHDSRLVDET